MNMLVISTHPDDETLGCGGTILKYKSLRRKVAWLNLTDLKEEYGYSRDSVSVRTREIERVKKAYKFDGFYNLRLRPAGLDRYPLDELITRISEVISRFRPGSIILPFRNDVHSDHRIACDAVFSAIKTFRQPCIKKVLMTEVLSETNFSFDDIVFAPDYFIDIGAFIEKKIKIMKLYKNEMKPHPFPRSEKSLRALAVLRGSQAGCEYAESFKLVKAIE
ncbi:MAG: PIG-L family deacetylase [Candidatus Omnitrophica bacterium]|nr:PIG-L family deacetylase [Candidatus Omnitrophota bacterium]